MPATAPRCVRCCPAHPVVLCLVTSRNQLTGLIATDGAHLIGLDPLTATESHELLSQGVGTARIAAEPQDSRNRLTVLTGDDPYSDLRAVFSRSYQTLSAAGARLFGYWRCTPDQT